MAMDTIFVTLAYCLLAFSSTVAENGTITSPTTITTTTSGLNLTQVTTASANSTVYATVITNSTAYVTQSTSTNLDNVTFTSTNATITESTSHALTSQSTTILTPLTNSTPPTPSTHQTTITALTTQTTQPTTGDTASPDTPVITTLSHTNITTSDSVNKTTDGSGLNMSDRNMTIVLSVVLGVFALTLVMLMFLKCKHKFQYLHQPLNNSDDMGAIVAEDTLVISGGLYDGHPIYDNVPPAPEDQSQFRLEFLH